VRIVIWELDDLAAPEGVFILVDLLPKVTPPLKIILVDVEVVGIGEAAQQRWRQRNDCGDALRERRRRDWSNRLRIVLPPSGK
jgi:hypothetical protein